MARLEATVGLFTKEGLPSRYETKWEDIQDASKNLLRALEARILEYWEESAKLDEENLEPDGARNTQELEELSSAITRNNASLEALQTIKAIMQTTEIAVGSFKRLAVSVSAAEESRLAADEKRGQYKTPEDHKVALDFYTGLPSRPSPFFQHTMVRIEQQLEEYRRQVREIDQLLCGSDMDIPCEWNGRLHTPGSFLGSLLATEINSHGFFMHVTAQVEHLHEDVERMREKYLADLRRRGIHDNPFLEADPKEELKRQIEAQRVHPTLHTLNPSSEEASGSRGRPISQQIQQPNSFVSGSYGVMSYGSPGASVQPLDSPEYGSVTQVDGSLVASNQILRPASLQIPGRNNDSGARVISNRIRRYRFRTASVPIPGGNNNAGASVTANHDQIARSGVSSDTWAEQRCGSWGTFLGRVTSKTARKRP